MSDERSPGTSGLLGRDESLRRLLTLCSSPEVQFVAVTGPAGIGRSAFLTHALRGLRAGGTTSRLLLLAPQSRPRGHSAVHRLAETMARLREEAGPGRAVLLVDDLQVIDQASLSLADHLLLLARQRSVTLVCAIRTPVAQLAGGAPATWRRVCSDHRTASVRLRPLSSAVVEDVVTTALGCAAAPNLVRCLTDLTLGVPGAVHAVLDSWRDADAVLLRRGQAHLADPVRCSAPAIERDSPLLGPLHPFGERGWQVITAAALLAVVGARMPEVVAEVTGLPPDEVTAWLAALVAAGVLRGPGDEQRWRFQPPVLANAVLAQLGPYERARLACAVVASLHRTCLSEADARVLTENVAVADGLADAEPALRGLVAWARVATDRHPRQAACSMRVAARSGDRATRTAALLLGARAGLLSQDFAVASASAGAVLAEQRAALSPGEVDELEFTRTFTGHLLGDHDRPVVVTGGGRDDADVTAAAVAGRWPELISTIGTEHTAPAGRLVTRTASALAGEPAALDWLLSAEDTTPLHVGELTLVAGRPPLLAALGEHRAAAALVESDVGEVPLTTTILAFLDAARPWDELLDVIERDPAIRPGPAGLGEAVLVREASVVLAGTGSLRRAAELLGSPRTVTASVLTCAVRADIAITTGLHRHAEELVVRALAEADDAGLVAGTDELLLRAGELALWRGAPGEAAPRLDRLQRVAHRIGTSAARVNAAKGRFLVNPDRDTAAELVGLVARRDRPYDSLRAHLFLAEHGHVDPDLVREAYYLAGDLRALLWRARLRKLMRSNEISVPSRRQSTQENEELLTAMVSDGLTNSEIAKAMLVSEKSVEGYLGRMFQRLGYRSRVDVAAGGFRGGGRRPASGRS